MSYVRMGKTSDVYVWGGGSALELVIANNKGSAGKVPCPPPGSSAEKFQAYMDDVIPFDHPEAGKHYSFTSRKECLSKLEELSRTGVLVPAEVFTRLENEIATIGDKYSVR